jgi:hypothetical protein
VRIWPRLRVRPGVLCASWPGDNVCDNHPRDRPAECPECGKRTYDLGNM